MTININGWLIAFAVSSIFNLSMIFYVRYLLRILVSSSERVVEFNDEIIKFTAHIKGITELEAFYGDPTITGLLKHSLYILDVVEGCSEIMDITEPNEEIELEEQHDREENIDTDTDTQEAPRTEVEAEVFYAGSRRRDN